MRPSSLFFIWFAANLTIGDFAIGFLPIALGISFSDAVIALLSGKLTGGAVGGAWCR